MEVLVGNGRLVNVRILGLVRIGLTNMTLWKIYDCGNFRAITSDIEKFIRNNSRPEAFDGETYLGSLGRAPNIKSDKLVAWINYSPESNLVCKKVEVSSFEIWYLTEEICRFES